MIGNAGASKFSRLIGEIVSDIMRELRLIGSLIT
jgi:hypothetical protein